MEDTRKELAKLSDQLETAISKLDLPLVKQELSEIQSKIGQPDFWEDNQAAQEVMRQKARLEQKIVPWENLSRELKEVTELLAMDDPQLKAEIEQAIYKLRIELDSLKEQLKLNGPYDDHDAILLISAGAGGTDAQDWAAMLVRMYTRWAEQNGYKVALVAESTGEEAGIKSATLEVSGAFAYGKLSLESGVHRLVRLSPFNSDNLRQTSFAKVSVLPKLDKPDRFEIDPKQLKIDVFRAGGHGGQSVNTTDSAVRITHIPTGITVSIQNERSQLQNKETAMGILQARLVVLKMEQHQDKIEAIKGPNQSAEWGNQIRNYVLHPYKLVKDLRSKYETANADDVLDGKLNDFINAGLDARIGQTNDN